MFDVISPEDACQAMGAGQTVYIDVRTTAEFVSGHPAGAYHVPLMDADPVTGVPGFNAAFTDQIGSLQRHLMAAGDAAARGTTPLLILGCQVGARSNQACQLLAMAGVAPLADCAAGWSGQRDGIGRVIASGWQALELPTATAAEPGRSWPEIRALMAT